MRVLVTRPEPEATDLARRLKAMGHTVVIQPLLRIEPSPEPSGLAEPAAIAVTSQNGIRALARWGVARSWRSVPVYAVGQATAAAARAEGFATVKTASGDVAHLAAFIAADFNAGRGMLLHAAARDRAADLAALLPGIAVTTVEAYRAEAATALDPAVEAALKAGQIDAVLLFSRRTAETFAALIRKAGAESGLRRTVLLALSPQVAEPLGGLAGRVLVAPKPEEASLLALLNRPVAQPG